MSEKRETRVPESGTAETRGPRCGRRGSSAGRMWISPPVPHADIQISPGKREGAECRGVAGRARSRHVPISGTNLDVDARECAEVQIRPALLPPLFDAAQRIVGIAEFRFYAIADGIENVLYGRTRPVKAP